MGIQSCLDIQLFVFDCSVFSWCVLTLTEDLVHIRPLLHAKPPRQLTIPHDSLICA